MIQSVLKALLNSNQPTSRSCRLCLTY